MDKRERLEKTIAGESTDRVPVALWRHWPGDDQRSADLAQSLVDFQMLYDWDFLRITPSHHYSVRDYGVQDDWNGTINGKREILKHAVKRSLEWTELRTLDPSRGELYKQLDTVRLLEKALGQSVPFVQTVYSPLTQAEAIAGRDLLFQNMRLRADRLRSGLNIVTESTLRFLEALRRTSIAGIFYVIQHANYETMTEYEYRAFGEPFDRKILESIPESWWLNAVQVQGISPMIDVVADYPVQILNWRDKEQRPTLAEGQAQFRGAVCGGLSHWDHLHQGTPAIVRDAVRQARQSTNQQRFILSVDQDVLVTSPLSNMRAARDAVENVVV